MADLSDVETALVDALMRILYPNGTASRSVLAILVKVFRGLPLSGAPGVGCAGIVEISVFPEPDGSRNTTRWGVQTFNVMRLPGLAVATVDNTATFAGTALDGDLAGVLLADMAFVYAAHAGDSAALAAAILADKIRAFSICWVTGATLTVPGYSAITARTATPALVLEEWGRQEQRVRLAVRAPTPQMRDTACGLISAQLAATPFLTLADGTGGHLRYHSTISNDDDQASSVYRRNLIYTVEYGTTLARPSPTVLFGDLNWNGQTFLV